METSSAAVGTATYSFQTSLHPLQLLAQAQLESMRNVCAPIRKHLEAMTRPSGAGTDVTELSEVKMRSRLVRQEGWRSNGSNRINFYYFYYFHGL